MATGLLNVLHELQVSNGLDMAAVVSADGLVVESASAGDMDVESICSVASNGLLMMDALGQELGQDQAQMTTIEYPDRIVVMAPLSDDYLLILLSGAGMNLGRLRLVLRRKLDELAQELESI